MGCANFCRWCGKAFFWGGGVHSVYGGVVPPGKSVYAKGQPHLITSVTFNLFIYSAMIECTNWDWLCRTRVY